MRRLCSVVERRRQPPERVALHRRERGGAPRLEPSREDRHLLAGLALGEVRVGRGDVAEESRRERREGEGIVAGVMRAERRERRASGRATVFFFYSRRRAGCERVKVVAAAARSRRSRHASTATSARSRLISARSNAENWRPSARRRRSGGRRGAAARARGAGRAASGRARRGVGSRARADFWRAAPLDAFDRRRIRTSPPPRTRARTRRRARRGSRGRARRWRGRARARRGRGRRALPRASDAVAASRGETRADGVAFEGGPRGAPSSSSGTT